MKFNLPLTEAQLSELRQKLAPLASDVTYQSNTLNIEADAENADEITDTVLPYLPIVTDLPDWLALTRAHGKPLAALREKRRLQEAAR